MNYEVFANNKWNPIKKVIRHKTNKKIYRVNTHCGVVDVTEDHSLLSDKREKIKPGECVVGETKLFHCFPNEFNEVDAYVPQQNEPKEEINKAYLKIQKKIHPDISPETSRLSSIVNEARDVLLNEIK